MSITLDKDLRGHGAELSWRLADTSVEALKAEWQAAGLAPETCPALPDPITLLGRVMESLRTRRGQRWPLPVKAKKLDPKTGTEKAGETVGYFLVTSAAEKEGGDATARHRQLAYVSLTSDGAGGFYPYLAQHAGSHEELTRLDPAVREAWKKYTTLLVPADMRAYLVKTALRSGVMLDDGRYFIEPGEALEELRRARSAIRAANEANRVRLVTVLESEADLVEAVLDGVAGEGETLASELEEALSSGEGMGARASATRAAEAARVRAKLARYERILGTAAPRVAARLAEIELRAQQMAMAATQAAAAATAKAATAAKASASKAKAESESRSEQLALPDVAPLSVETFEEPLPTELSELPY